MQRAPSPGAYVDPLMVSQKGFSVPSLRGHSYPPVQTMTVPVLGSVKNVVRAPSPPAAPLRLQSTGLQTPGRSLSGSLASPVLHGVPPLGGSASPYAGGMVSNKSLSSTLQALKAASAATATPGSSVASSVNVSAVSTPGRPGSDAHVNGGLIVRQATRETVSSLTRQGTMTKASGAAAPGRANPKPKSSVRPYSGPGSPSAQFRPAVVRSSVEDKKARTLRVAYTPGTKASSVPPAKPMNAPPAKASSMPVKAASVPPAKAKSMPVRRAAPPVEVSQYATPKQATVIDSPLIVTERVEATVRPYSNAVSLGSPVRSAETGKFAVAPKVDEVMPPPVVMDLPVIEAPLDGMVSNGSSSTQILAEPTIRITTGLYFVDNTHLQTRTDGLSFRRSKNLDDKHPKYVPWNHAVKGSDEGDGWLNVDGRYLPFFYDGKPVIAKEQYVVCNRALGHETQGLGFRASKDHSDKVDGFTASWGTKLSGTPEAGWLRVGDHYLPMSVNGVPTVRVAESREVLMAPPFEELREVRIESAPKPRGTTCLAGCGQMCSPSWWIPPADPVDTQL